MARQNPKRAFEDAKDRALSAGLCVADIVKVISFDEGAMRVDVLPLTRYPDEDGYQTKPQILSVPVAMVCGGGYTFRPVYKSGDIGMVVYLDRDSDATIAGGVEADPNTERLHSGDDAVFIGGILAGNRKVAQFPSGALVMGTNDGSVFLAIGKSGIEIKGNVTITGNFTTQGGITRLN